MAVPRDYASLTTRVTAAAQDTLSCHVYGQQATPDGGEAYNLLIVSVPAARAPASGRRPRRVLLNGGTHGDEPAGTEAVTRFLEERWYERWPQVEFTIAPCMNPWGYVHGRREGPGGLDLNRSFGQRSSAIAPTHHAPPEVALLERAVGGQSIDVFLDCHEDVDAPGMYVFAPAALGRTILDASARLGPVHLGSSVDTELPLREGVVELDGTEARQRRAAARTWPLPAGSWAASLSPKSPNVGQVATATLETPVHLPLEQRVAMHLAGIEAALSTL